VDACAELLFLFACQIVLFLIAKLQRQHQCTKQSRNRGILKRAEFEFLKTFKQKWFTMVKTFDESLHHSNQGSIDLFDALDDF